MAAFLQISWEG